MKKGIVFRLILLMTVVFQVWPGVFAQNGNGVSNSKNETHFVLEANEKRQAIEIPDNCFVLLRDYPTIITLPLGKQFEWKLPKGTKFKIPAGLYQLENKSNSTLEFKLLSAEECREDKIKSEK